MTENPQVAFVFLCCAWFANDNDCVMSLLVVILRHQMILHLPVARFCKRIYFFLLQNPHHGPLLAFSQSLFKY